MKTKLIRSLFLLQGLALMLVASMCLAAEGEGEKRLKQFHKDVRTLRASFYQQLKDANGEVVQESRGSMTLQRPEKFRWDYTEPYPQLIVGDGKTVWIHDSELEQVTIKPMGNVVGNAPSLILSGARPLEKDFHIKEVGKKSDGLLWLELRPKLPESDFKVILVGFGKYLEKLVMIDNFGQVTTIKLSNLKMNQKLKKSVFVFKMPKGVDVIRR